MKRKIVLHGSLRELIPDTVELDASTVADAIRGLSTIYADVLRPHPIKGRHTVQVLGYDTEESLHTPLGSNVTELHLLPVFTGGKKGGFIQIVVGAMLIVAAYYLGPGGSGAIGQTMTNMMYSVGASLILGGVLALLSPAPKMDNFEFNGTGASEGSLYLGNPKNTTKIGTRIPILYGKFRTYGQLLSADIQAADVAA